MYKEMIARYIELVKELDCAIAIFTEEGKIIHLNDEALDILGYNVINMELQPGRYVENEDFWDNLKRHNTLFTHKALLKAGTNTYKIRGMVHVICEANNEENMPRTYALAFEIRDERIFGSVTLERIVENAGFVAFHLVAPSPSNSNWYVRYVSNSVVKFGYTREDFYNKPSDWMKVIYKEDLPRLNEEMKSNLQLGKYEYTRQYRIISKAGQIIPVHDYVHLVVDTQGILQGVEVVIFDLLMETERNANLLLLENALNRSHNTVLVWQCHKNNMDRNLRYVSDNIDYYGISSAALRSGQLDYGDVIYPEDRDGVEKIYEGYMNKGYQYLSQEYRICGKDGHIFWIRDESNLVTLPDGITYVESILTDISDTKRREQQLMEQQEDLQRKIKYIESNETMLSDLSVLDFISKEELQELQTAFASITDSYNAIIDLDGEPLTFPDGPEVNMGAFYDMFERSEYKNGYFKLNKQLRKEHGPVQITLDELRQPVEETQEEGFPTGGSLMELIKAASKEKSDFSQGLLVGIPLFIDDKHMATWISCAFTEEEQKKLQQYEGALWSICQYMAKYVYSNTIREKEARHARVSEIHARELLNRNSTIRDILRRCNETNDDTALEYVLHRVGQYLKVSRISLFRYTESNEFPTCWYEWDADGMPKNVDNTVMHTHHHFEMQKQAFEEQGEVVLNGDKLPIRVRRILSDNHVRAIVSLPIYTLTKEQQYISFVESNYERIWTKEELSFMHTTVSILQGFLQRMRSNVNLHDVTETQVEFMNLSREFIYVKDEVTDEIVYVNPRLEEIVGANAIGKKCYEVFRRQSIHCMDCYQKDKECHEICNSRMYMHMFGHPMRMRNMQVDWVNNQKMLVVMMSPEDTESGK